MSELPKGWTQVAIGDVASISRRTVDPHTIDPLTPYVGLEHIESGGRLLPHPTTGDAGIKSAKVEFTKEHVLVGKLRPYLAKITTAPHSGVASTDILPLLPGDQLDRRFLLHYLRQRPVVDQLNGLATGANLPRLSPKALAGFKLPLPPLPEQRRIAAILDKATVLTAAVSQHGELVRSLWETTFNSHYAALSDVEPSTLDECSVIGSGITKGRKVPTSSELHDTPYLTVANVQDGYLALDEVKKIAVTEAEQEKYRLEHGDVLLTEGGDPDKLGRGTIWRDEVPGAINQNHVFRVRPNGDQVDPTYLALALRTPESRAYFHRQAKQTTGIATINKTQLRRTPVYLPSLDVQRHIVHRCEAVASTEASNNRRVEAARSLVAALQSRAFRGEL